MNAHNSKDPLQRNARNAGQCLVERYGWAELAQRINISFFKNEPSVKSQFEVSAPYAVGAGQK